MQKISLILFFKLCFFNVVFSQIGIGTTTPNASAALEIRDNTKGLLIPRMRADQRLAISNPAEGLIVYQTDNAEGYWYYDGVQWRNVNYGNYGGRQSIVLADTISNAQAQLKVLEDFGVNTQSIKIVGCSNLTSIDLSMITSAIDVLIADNSVLQTVNLSGLTRCDGSFKVMNCPALTNLNLNALGRIVAGNSGNIDGFVIQNTRLSGINLANLKKIIGSIVVKENNFMTAFSLPQLSGTPIYRLELTGNNQLASFSVPLLENVIADVSVNNNPLLTTFTLEALKNTGWFDINNNNGLLNVSFPLLTGILGSASNSSSISKCPNMTSINFGNLNRFDNPALFVTDNRLPSTRINNILSRLVSITPNLTNKTIFLSQLIPAPPTGQGVTDKTILISRGNNVFTD